MTDVDAIAREAAIGANQHESELRFMCNLVAERKPKRILEIGVESGWSMWAWARCAADDAALMGIDAEWHSTMFSDVQSRYPWPAGERQSVKWFKGDSRAADTVTAAHEWATTPVDFLFIDADHSYDAVMQDWANYSPLVAKGGLVGFHDVANQASEAWAVLKRDHRTVEFVDPDNAGMGMGVILL